MPGRRSDLGQSFWRHLIIRNPQLGRLLPWHLHNRQQPEWRHPRPITRSVAASGTLLGDNAAEQPAEAPPLLAHDSTLSFIRRSFTMKLATRDLSGAANCSGASCARCPTVVRGVMSCSMLVVSRPLWRGCRGDNTP